MSEAQRIINDLREAAAWLKEHGRNTNTALIGICERAAEYLEKHTEREGGGMIELDVAEYCHECPEFDAEVTRVYADNKVARMVVSCAHWRMCREIHRTVKERLEKEERIKREGKE